jgi:outer membrane protein TolC
VIRRGPERRAAVAALVMLLAGAAHAEPMRLTFEGAVNRALAQNVNMVSATEAIYRAEALVSEARAGLFPALTGNAQFTHLDHERILTTGDTRRTVTGQNQRSANLQLTVPLLAPAALNASSRAKDAVAVSEAAASDVRRQVALAAGRAYLAVLAQKRVVEASERARDTAKAHHDNAAARLAGGIGRSLDEVRAAQELAVSETQVEAAYAGLARAREALGIIVAADSAVDVAGETFEPGRGTGVLDRDLAEVTNRQDVQAARARATAAERTTKDRWTFYAPFVAAVGTPFYQNPASLVNPELGWQVQLVLTLPIYDGGRRGAVFREQDTVIRDTRAQLENQLRQARAEVRAGFEVLLRADRGLTAARQSVTLALKSLELATLAYTAGATSNLEVIDAERRARDAETAAAVAEDSARLARLDLLAASGRFPPAR